jgi:hypothetical protein
MKLKRGNDIIDVPENKVVFFIHAGYVKVENVATSKKSRESEDTPAPKEKSAFDNLLNRKREE